MSARLAQLEARHPEWSPWLAVIAPSLQALGDPAWAAAWSPTVPWPSPSAPLLAGARIGIDPAPVRALFESLLAAAARSGSDRLATLAALPRSDDVCITTLGAALNGRDALLDEYAAAGGADSAALRAVAGLLAMPLLHAGRERCGGTEHWDAGHCPVCAQWPAYAEVRGIERTRYLRCGACGAAWGAAPLECARCGNRDHESLAALVVEGAKNQLSLEVCARCGSYLKVATALQGAAPADVMLEDLATADLDLAAAQRGYARPGGRACELGVVVRAAAAASGRR